ncbi:MAG TPA: TPM domain-containing protein [Rhodanobacteraceae bacterium]|nr:TPM domain-containing protein [Rhodanobacteraceae bacterium]
MRRALRHLFSGSTARRAFPRATLDAIQHAVAASEHTHLGEICFAVESALPSAAALRGVSARERAHAVFSRLRVWNTAHNSGVLVYVLMADQAIEIVADRGIAARVDAHEWTGICATMRKHFAAGDYHGGTLAGIAAIGTLLARHFPADGRDNPDELPDRPVLPGR